VEHILSSRLFNSRGGTLLVGGAAAVLAAIVVLVYVAQYRHNVNASNAEVTVLVAKRLITKGTPGNYVGSAGLFAPTTVVQKHVRTGAITDPAALRGRVAISDIYPGQQLTVADFSVALTDALPTHLAQTQRAIAIPIDSAHGLVGQLQPGDHVDVYAGFNVDSARGGGSGPVIKLLMQNALILRVPGVHTGIGAGSSSNVVLRASYQQAAEIAFASDNGKIWLVARPNANAQPTPPELVTVESLLLGVPPVTVYRNLRRYVAVR
jgi:Flp pilus assembly protein CpaB